MNSTETANVQLAERAYEALLADDLDAFLELCAPEVVLVYPRSGQPAYLTLPWFASRKSVLTRWPAARRSAARRSAAARPAQA